uniref:Uncharacterized protein n=1 Tax=Arundo donax TaxID=35708 RepID=A0A0A9HNV8_ARUDO
MYMLTIRNKTYPETEYSPIRAYSETKMYFRSSSDFLIY